MYNFVRWRRRGARADEVLVISGNNKIGATPAVSLLPVVTCDRRAPCAKNCECYAKQLEFRGGAVWRHNTELAKADPEQFFRSLREQFAQRAGKVPFFRFFVSGDIPSRKFLDLLMCFCLDHPETKFLVFTKRYGWVAKWLDENARPGNTAIVLSAWPGWKMANPHGLPVAWMRDPENMNERIPADAIECPHGCDSCGMCWNLPQMGRDVVFDKH